MDNGHWQVSQLQGKCGVQGGAQDNIDGVNKTDKQREKRGWIFFLVAIESRPANSEYVCEEYMGSSIKKAYGFFLFWRWR